ncbi:MAG: hypothetical protein IKH82_06475 [Clostridiales bacterium]|nr:hypothetical protein [Clostridiales bacterium]
MRQTDFFEVIGNIDDTYVKEAATYRKVSRIGDKSFLIGAAALLIVIAGVVTLFVRIFSGITENRPTTIHGSTGVMTEETPATTLPEITEEYCFEPVNDITGTQLILVSVRVEDSKAKVKFTNMSDEPWKFGEHYKLQVLIGNEWYYVPSEDYIVHEILHEISPGAEYEMTYDLSPFGELTAGDYRISCGGTSFTENVYYANFTVTADGIFIGTDPTVYTEET